MERDSWNVKGQKLKFEAHATTLLRSHDDVGLLGQIASPMKYFCVDDLEDVKYI